ncbi:Rho GTPase activation protein [Radiomyces spectabilis]|uniref:Rho GTPase activation protein n=1 Tax=Radiomyces spectabilis TaxID=64574 RepID=UPI002220320F|nr:Rho GTPase activation protein [Radiomyces spectabilis]KAI8371647.1 Rho GTPase activation protein [Radiomyces spectabilis]
MNFLKKRAAIEEEYGKQMMKLAQSMCEGYEKAHPKSSTYGQVWSSMLKVHETIGSQRIKFSSDISEVADDLQLLYKDSDKARRQAKEAGQKHEKALMDAENNLEKGKAKYESYSEEWERTLLQKSNDPSQIPKKGLFKNNKTQAQLDRQEEEARSRAAAADQAYKQHLQNANTARQIYYQTHLPKTLRELKSIGDECSVALRYQLARYAYIYEQALTADGLALDNDDGLGLRSLTEKIDIDGDLAAFVDNFRNRAGTAQKNDIPYKEYVMSPTAITILNPNPVFGIPLTALMNRDKEEVPLVLQRCVEAIEQCGLRTVGLYRVSGTKTHVAKLKTAFDHDCSSVNLVAEEDVHNITTLLKLWLSELPDPVFPRSTFQHFMNAAKIEDERMRILGLHTVINDMPDAHYATLKYLMCHLDKVQRYQQYNKMNSANLGAIFGMSLMGNNHQSTESTQEKLNEADWQMVVVTTILHNYRLIFEPDDA